MNSQVEPHTEASRNQTTTGSVTRPDTTRSPVASPSASAGPVVRYSARRLSNASTAPARRAGP
jgi:hypothetical protein